MSQEMTSKDIRLGVWVEPLPSHLRSHWAKRNTWPQQITEIADKGFEIFFKLSNNRGLWSTTGLCVVDLEVEENE